MDRMENGIPGQELVCEKAPNSIAHEGNSRELAR